MNRQQLFSLGFFAVLALLLYQIGLMFLPFLFPVLWAVIFAHLAFPVHMGLTTWLRGRETVAAAALTIGVMALGVVPLVLVGGLLVREASSAEQAIRHWVAEGGIQQLSEHLTRLPWATGLVQELSGRAALKQANLEQFVLSNSKALSEFMVNELSVLVRNVFLLVADFLVMIFTLFFLFRDGRRWLDSLYDLLPLESSHKEKIFARLDQTIRAVVKGLLLTAIVQGLLAGSAYALLGLPFPVVLTALTMLLAPLPFGGTVLVWGPAALYLFWVGPAGKALVMLVWGAGVVSMVDHILKPLFIGQGAQIPVLLLTFSVLGGLALYGIIGLFLGPILVGLFLTAIQIYRDEYHAPSSPQAPPAQAPPR